MSKISVKIIGKRPHIQALQLTRITVDFVSSVKAWCNANKVDYKETLSFMLETIKENEELTNNAN